MVLTQDIVKEFFDYDPEIGDLIWRKRDRRWFKTLGGSYYWNKRYAGKVAGTIDVSHGYMTVSILNRNYREHRIIFLREYGRFPKEIDHINHIKTDNKLCNLREVSSRENQLNKTSKYNISSDITGVYWNVVSNKWQAQVIFNEEFYYLGLFTDIVNAAKAVQDFHSANGFHPNHGKKVSDIS